MSATESSGPVHTRAVIIGTGFSGLGMGIALQRQGVDFLILEKADDIGGTWRENSYPGCACDVPSHLYSFSFEPKADWTRMFSPQPEILEYLSGVADKYGLRRYIRFGSTVDRAHWDEAEQRWHVFTAAGQEYVAQFLISGAGPLHIPALPDIEGIDEFAGPAFHSARWRHDVDLTGKRVALVGTGASAIQILPEIVKRVGEVQLYQRTPAWVMPRPNLEIPPRLRTLLTYVPGLRPLLRGGIYGFLEATAFGMTRRPAMLKVYESLGRWNIRRNIADKELRRRLTPDYSAGCKRILYSPNYYRAVANPATTVVTDRIARITPRGIVTTDERGNEVQRDVDVIVFATGFRVTDAYTHLDIKGPGGEDLVDRWNREGMAALRGTTVAGMPNLFLLLGPNTGLGHSSMVYIIESQIRYVSKAIAAVDAAGAEALTPTRPAQDAFNAAVQDRLGHSVWNTGGCRSWYLDDHGRNRVLWSGFTWEFRRATRSLEPAEYEFSGAAASGGKAG